MLALMILLLPLRGWLGDAMATEMAGKTMPVMQQQVATKIIAGHAHKTSDASHLSHETPAPESAQALLDCAGHSSETALQPTASHDGHCGSCQVCQVCHSVALSPPAVILVPAFKAPGLPRAIRTRLDLQKRDRLTSISCARIGRSSVEGAKHET